MSDVDYDALAKKFGGMNPEQVDALAAKFGGVSASKSGFVRPPDALDDPNMATTGMSGLDKWLAGSGKNIAKPLRGIGQRLGLVSDADVEEARRLDAPLERPAEVLPPIEGGKLGIHRDPNRPARTVMGPAGFGSAMTDIALMAPFAAIPGINTVAGGALLGGVSGFIQPTGSGESVLSNTVKSAALGGGTNAAVRLAPSVAAATVQPFFKSGQQRLAGAVLDEFGVPASIPANTGATPGWQPTLAEAVGKPSVSIMQRGLHSLDGREGSVGDLVTQRGVDNNAAAVAALRGLAGTPLGQKFNLAARDYMAGPLYKQASEEGIDQGMAAAMKPQIKNLMDRPSMKLAASVAKNTFGEESITLAKQGDVKGLQYMKQALDDIIEKASSPTSSIGRNQLGALRQTRADLISTMQDIAPKLREADQQYATFSRPINESAVAQELEKKLVPALQFGKDDPLRLTANRFASTVNELDDKIPQLTGYPGATVKNTMSHGGMKTLDGIFTDLQRRENLSLGRGEGSNTGQNLASQNLIKRTLGPMGFPEGASQWAAQSAIGRTLGRVGDIIYKIPDKEIQAELAKAVLDPQYAAQLVSKANTPMLKGKVKMAAQILQLMAAPTALSVANSQKQ